MLTCWYLTSYLLFTPANQMFQLRSVVKDWRVQRQCLKGHSETKLQKFYIASVDTKSIHNIKHTIKSTWIFVDWYLYHAFCREPTYCCWSQINEIPACVNNFKTQTLTGSVWPIQLWSQCVSTARLDKTNTLLIFKSILPLQKNYNIMKPYFQEDCARQNIKIPN